MELDTRARLEYMGLKCNFWSALLSAEVQDGLRLTYKSGVPLKISSRTTAYTLCSSVNMLSADKSDCTADTEAAADRPLDPAVGDDEDLLSLKSIVREYV